MFNRGAESRHAHFSRFEKRNGEGQAVTPSLKIKPFLNWTPAIQVFREGKLLPSPRMPIEKIVWTF